VETPKFGRHDVHFAIPAHIPDREGEGEVPRSVVHFGLERSVSVSEEHRYGVVVIAGGHDVGIAVIAHVRDCHGGRTEPRRIVDFRLECSVPVA
jgi:hypothetical protein